MLSVDILNGGDMLSEPLFRYLCNLCEAGRVVAIIGGPPCSTVSRLRERGGTDEGPRVLRKRLGPERFGIEDLTMQERRQVDEHGIMLLRMKALYFVANQNSLKEVLYICEQPADPAEYAKGAEESASFWAWPEVKSFEEQFGMRRASFSQGFFGHPTTKPTTLLTNSWRLFTTVHGCYSKPRSSEYLRDWDARIRQAQGWSKWAAGLCRAIGEAIVDWVTSTLNQRKELEMQEGAVIKSMLTKDDEAFIEHCKRDHVGFRRDCNVCLAASVRGHQHFRQKHPYGNALTLNLDLIGPLCRGEDQLGPAKHLLVGVLGVPLYADGRPQYLDEARKAGDPEILF